VAKLELFDSSPYNLHTEMKEVENNTKLGKIIHKGANLGLALTLAACGNKTGPPTKNPEITSVKPTISEISPAPIATETALPPSETPTPTMPSEFANVPDNFIAVHNIDSSWSLGYMPEGLTEPIIIPGLLPDPTGIKLEILGEPFIITTETVGSQVKYDPETQIVRFFDPEGDLTAEFNQGETNLVDVRQLHDGCYYGRDEINSFVKISQKTTEINATPYDVIIGTDSEGKETVLAAKMTTYEGKEVWTRISTSDLGGDNGKMIIWINPDQDGAVQVNDKTAEVFISRFFEVVKDGGQGPAITSMKDGKLTIETPYAYDETGFNRVSWETIELDMKNVEILLIQSPVDWAQFVKDHKSLAAKTYSSSFQRSGRGLAIFPTDNGTLIVVLMQDWIRGTSVTPLEIIKINGNDEFAHLFWDPLSVFAYRREDHFALGKVMSGNADAKYPHSEVLSSFEIVPTGLLEKKPN
jgi:hypothetical protein